MNDNPFIGLWTYRSFLNDPKQVLDDPDQDAKLKKLDQLVFGFGTIEIVEAPSITLKGKIGGTGSEADARADGRADDDSGRTAAGEEADEAAEDGSQPHRDEADDLADAAGPALHALEFVLIAEVGPGDGLAAREVAALER